MRKSAPKKKRAKIESKLSMPGTYGGFMGRYGRGKKGKYGKYFKPQRRPMWSAGNPPYGRKVAVPPAILGNGTGYKVKRALAVSAQQAELKFQTYQDSAQALDVLGDLHNLTTVTQGFGVNNRVGNEINVKYIDFSGVIRTNTAGASATVSMIIFWDEDPDVDPDYADVMTSSTSNTANSVINPMNSGRYKVLAHRTFGITPTSTEHRVRPFRIKRIPINRKIRWSSAANDTQASGSVWVIFITDDTSVSNTHNFDFVATMCYTDM